MIILLKTAFPVSHRRIGDDSGESFLGRILTLFLMPVKLRVFEKRRIEAPSSDRFMYVNSVPCKCYGSTVADNYRMNL